MRLMTSALVLTFHGIQDQHGTFNVLHDPAANRYVVSSEFFEKAVNKISTENCCTVTDFLYKSKRNCVVLTFDDGLISDFEIVFPLLLERELKGSFFITVKNIGRNGFTSVPHLREMAKAGMEIGSHGLTHRYLVAMHREEALEEIRKSKERLEQQIGVKIKSFAPVGGHYHKWMVEAVKKSGYKVFASMVPGRTPKKGNPLFLRRNHIQAKHNTEYVSTLLEGSNKVLWQNRLRYEFLQFPKRILGIKNYDLIKGHILNIYNTKGFQNHINL